MKIKFLSILFFVLTIPLFSQENYSHNTVYGEFLGRGGFYSINYDRLFVVKEKTKISLSVGFSTLNNFRIHYYPIGLSVLLGNKHHLEFGPGITVVEGEFGTADFKSVEYQIYSSYTFLLGYRFQKKEGGLMFRPSYLVGFSSNDVADRDIYHWLGFAIGYTFKNK